MILLSRLIKSNWANQDNQKEKIISIKYVNSFHEEDYISQQEQEKILDHAYEEANEIKRQALEDIEKDRHQLLVEKQNWELERAHLIEEAKTEGIHIGIEEGRTSGYEEYIEVIQKAKTIVDSSKEDYMKYLQSAEKMILELGIKVAEKIINKTMEDKEENFLSLVKKVLKEMRDQKEIQIHVHPTHYQFVLSEKEELLHLFPIQPNIFIFPDENVEENGCIIETANGRIDASVDSQLTLIKDKLIDLLESE
jgi:flagellar assembly protein FliH